jgi:hypothetical protein
MPERIAGVPKMVTYLRDKIGERSIAKRTGLSLNK